MSVQKVEVEVTKEAYELTQGLKGLIASVKTAVADGFQPGQDLPVIVAASFASLPAALDGIDKLGSELTENKAAFVKAFMLLGADLFEMFSKAPVAKV